MTPTVFQFWRVSTALALLRRVVAGGAIFGCVVQASVPLIQLTPTVYQTEHCLFIIDSTVTWSVPTTAYNDLFGNGTLPKLSGYYDTLTTQFPGIPFFSICYIAQTGASNVPNYIDRAYKATGISEPGTAGAAPSFATVDICRYNLGTGAIFAPVLAVYDHELGHAWGAQLFADSNFPMLANGHWLPNSTVDCQLGGNYTDDGYLTVKKIYGDPTNGFRWQKVDNLRSNDTSTFSEQELYLMGVQPTFPTSYVLNNPVFNADGTMSESSVDTFDHALAVSRKGARNPDYTTSPKQFRLGFVYVARDLAEVNSVYQAVEISIDHFCNAEAIDPAAYRFQTPFLSDTHYRASVVGRLSDLDGNPSPTLTVGSGYVTSTDGSASVSFSPSSGASVAVVPASDHCSINGTTAQLSGLPDGVHFFTLKATAASGKKAFAHFVVEVQRPAAAVAIVTQPVVQTVAAGLHAQFTVTASGTPASFSYRWMREAAGTSTWNDVSDGGSYSGSGSATLSVTASTAMNNDRFLCFVTNASGSATSQAAALVVNEVVPPISTQPVDQTIGVGSAVHFTTSAAGPPDTYGYFNYQWQRKSSGSSAWSDLADGAGVSGATTASLTLSGTTAAMSGDQVRCAISNTAGSATTAAATLTVNVRPSITTQPVSVSMNAGQTATFTVVASGTDPLTYQWSRYGVAVSGGTSATLTLANVQSTDAGAYTVLVTNSVGTATSNVGSLTVSAAAPSITSQPLSLSTTAGQSVSFSVSATGTTPFTYQWKKNGTAIAGATSATLSLTNVQSSDAATYVVVVTNSAGNVTSSSAALTVAAAAVPPSVVTPPLAVTVTAGQTASFSVVAGGTAPFTYQWLKSGVNLPGATSATLSLTNVQSSDAADYSVVIANSAGSATSAGATLTVKALVVAPTISSSPQSATVTAGQSVSLGVTAGGTTPLTYQWRKNGVAISGATGSTLSLTAVQTADAGDYTVVVTNSAGSATSSVATLAITAVAVSPGISVAPQPVVAAAGQDVVFTVVASGTAPLTYQWLKNGAAIAGATSPTLSLPGVQVPDAGSYAVTVTNVAGAVTSSPAALSVAVATNAPVIVTPPSGAAVTAGQSASFSVIASGTAPLSYQWQKDGAAIGGATQATYVLNTAQISDGGDYAVLVSNSAGSVLSPVAHLSVAPVLFPPTLVVQPANVSVAAGATAAFSVTAAGATGYQWQFNGAPIAGATGASLTLANVQSADAGAYAVVASNAAGSVASSAATLGIFSIDFSGSYFGSFGPEHDGGDFALVVRTDGTTALVANFGDAKQALVASAVQIDHDGSFKFGGSKASALAAADFYSGEVDGHLDGTSLIFSVPALGLTATATRSSSVASFANRAGLYEAVALGISGGEVYVALGDDGQALLLDFSGGAPRTAKVAVATDGSLQATLGVGSSSAATYTGALGEGGFHGSATVAAGNVSLQPLPVSSGRQRLVNISSRGLAGAGDRTMIAGFVVTGDAPKDVMIRAIGPTLTRLGVSGAMADPQLQLFSGQTQILANDNWSATGVDLAAKAVQLGAFPLDRGSRDAALLAHLAPGVYTAWVTSQDGTAGVAMIEVYDAGSTDPTAPKLVNISTRAEVGRDGDILIAGFVVVGDAPKKLLLRGAGPALAGQGVAGTLADPLLRLFQGETLLKQNDNWGDEPDAGQVARTAATIGAFSLAPESKDAAMMLYLAPGIYTVQLSGVGNTTGIGLIEVYEVTD